MTTDDDETSITVHYGDKIVTVKERFDKLERMQLLEGVGICLLLGIHIPEVGPLLVAAFKLLT
jgi:hypothetical protein